MPVALSATSRAPYVNRDSVARTRAPPSATSSHDASGRRRKRVAFLRAHGTPLLSSESIDLHQHLLDRISRIEGAELAGAKREVNSLQPSAQLAPRRALGS